MKHSTFADAFLGRIFLAITLGTAVFTGTLSSAQAALSLDSEMYLKETNIVQGSNNSGDLMLAKEINRAELMKIVVKTVASLIPDAKDFNNCFPDVKNEWFAPYICWAKDQGYIQGYDDGMFHPERLVTEAEALKIINNALTIGVDDSIPSSRPWYEGYYNAAIKKNLVGSDTGSRLGNPALRGDVFEQLARGISVTELKKDTFEKGDVARIPGRGSKPTPKPLTQEQNDILSILESTLDYGYQPQSGSGSSTVKIAFSTSDSRANISLSLGEISKVTGTKDMLDKAAVSVNMSAAVNISAMGETLDFTFNAKGSVIVDTASSIFMKLDEFSLITVTTPDVLKESIESIQGEVTPYIGKWYSIPMNDEIKEELKNFTANGDHTDMLKKYFAHTSDFLLIKKETTSYKGIEADHYTVTVDGKALVKNIPELVAKMSPRPINKYEFRNDLDMAAPYIEKFFANLSTEVWAGTSNHLLLATMFKLVPTSFIVPAELGQAGSLMLEILGNDEYTYPASVTIEIPANAEVLPNAVENMGHMLP